MASAKIGNLSQYPGEDKTYDDVIVDGSGNPVDLTGWLSVFTVHAYGDPSTVYFTKSTANIPFVKSTSSVALINPTPNQWVDVPGGVPVTGGAFTIAFWYKFPSLVSQSYFFVQGKSPFVTSTIGIASFASQRPNFFSGTLNAQGGTVPSNNNWHHWAITYDGANANVYLDGTLDGGPFTGTPNYTGTATKIGSPFGANLGLTGNIDDFRVYSVTKTAAQIAALASGVDDQFGISNYWPFNEGGGTTAFDIVGGLNGTLLNGAQFSADVPGTLTQGTNNTISLNTPVLGTQSIPVVRQDTVNMFSGQYGFYIERINAGGDVVNSLGLFTLLVK